MATNSGFDSLLLSQVRLGIITVLMTRKEAQFTDLRKLLGLTQGNLGIHLGKLEGAGYVAVKKAFVDRKPRTTVRITPKGKRAFLRHVERLEKVVRDSGNA
ncbi:MAG: winged helix-turn-helix domain-containing protein [Planctomycetota bacterium]|jgi:DNA-binding MarR family transcriptional regulator